ncbi:MAG: restriction endonuclease [Desulfurococcaceae archaeon]
MPKRRVRRIRRVVKRKALTQYEKGHLFEDVVERFFQQLGYKVEKNAKIRGYSGAVHEIDVLISKHGINGVVEVKNYDKPIPKDWVMKASNVAKDIGATEVYVVSASGFTPDAVKVAEVLDVKLLNINDMMKELKRATDITTLPTFYARPGVKPRTVKEHASRYVMKKLFKPVEEVSEVELLYYPFYVFESEYTYVEETGVLFTREIEKKMKLKILASAIQSALPVIDEDTVTLVDIKPVSKEEAELLNVISESDESLTISDLEEITGWNRQKLGKLLSNLVKSGLVEYEEEESESGRVVKVYYSSVPHPDELKEACEELIPEDLEHGKPNDSSVIDPKIPSTNLASTINSLYEGLKIHGKKLIYLPIYRVKLTSTEDDTYRYIYLTAFTSKLLLLEGIEE